MFRNAISHEAKPAVIRRWAKQLNALPQERPHG
jgi:hypothetical protein